MPSFARTVAIASLLIAGGCGSDDDGATGASATAAAASSAASATSAASSGAGGGGGATGAGGSVAAAMDYCTACGSPEIAGTIVNAGVTEASGIAASAVHANVMYVHNDSGDAPRFFAVDANGADLGSFDVASATADDWEDMARGPCGADSCLFFGDIGDNDEQRSVYVVYRVIEPASLGTGASIAADALPFVYPDGSHNAETLLVDPATGAPIVVTKVSSGVSGIYAFPLPLTPGRQVVLTKLGDVTMPGPMPIITGGAMHPLGHGLLLRTYTGLFYYDVEPGGGVGEALAAAPCQVPAASEKQGEAVTWIADGTGYVTVSEGKNPALHTAACTR